MLKSILLFIKTHYIITAITVIGVVGIAVAPMAVENYKLESNVRKNLGMLATSDNYEISNNSEINDNAVIDNTSTTSNITETDDTEPLTFKIEKIKHEYKDGSGTEYKIVPSYNKDFNEWTKAEKEEYMRVAEEANKIAREDYERIVAEEERKLQELSDQLDSK